MSSGSEMQMVLLDNEGMKLLLRPETDISARIVSVYLVR